MPKMFAVIAGLTRGDHIRGRMMPPMFQWHHVVLVKPAGVLRRDPTIGASTSVARCDPLPLHDREIRWDTVLSGAPNRAMSTT